MSAIFQVRLVLIVEKYHW